MQMVTFACLLNSIKHKFQSDFLKTKSTKQCIISVFLVCVHICVMLQELRNAHSEEIMGIRREEEMEMSDDDSDEIACKRMRVEENGNSSVREKQFLI